MERKVKATTAGDSASFRLGQTILVFCGYHNSERADWGREEHYLCFLTRLCLLLERAMEIATVHEHNYCSLMIA